MTSLIPWQKPVHHTMPQENTNTRQQKENVSMEEDNKEENGSSTDTEGSDENDDCIVEIKLHKYIKKSSVGILPLCIKFKNEPKLCWAPMEV
eukprot:12145076-Ditylum_brightwellii.AAC.1